MPSTSFSGLGFGQVQGLEPSYSRSSHQQLHLYSRHARHERTCHREDLPCKLSRGAHDDGAHLKDSGTGSHMPCISGNTPELLFQSSSLMQTSSNTVCFVCLSCPFLHTSSSHTFLVQLELPFPGKPQKHNTRLHLPLPLALHSFIHAPTSCSHLVHLELAPSSHGMLMCPHPCLPAHSSGAA